MVGSPLENAGNTILDAGFQTATFQTLDLYQDKMIQPPHWPISAINFCKSIIF